MPWTLADSAATMLDVKEVRGTRDNPLIVGMAQMFARWVEDDETAWCGAFAGFVLKVNGYPTPGPEPWRALQARRYLTIGRSATWTGANGNCLVILSRGSGRQPGPDTLDAPGHVGFYVGHDEDRVLVIGGNQGNRVSEKWFRRSRVLDLRRPKR